MHIKKPGRVDVLILGNISTVGRVDVPQPVSSESY
jgi:hypothetical protein